MSNNEFFTSSLSSVKFWKSFSSYFFAFLKFCSASASTVYKPGSHTSLGEHLFRDQYEKPGLDFYPLTKHLCLYPPPKPTQDDDSALDVSRSWRPPTSSLSLPCRVLEAWGRDMSWKPSGPRFARGRARECANIRWGKSVSHVASEVTSPAKGGEK